MHSARDIFRRAVGERRLHPQRIALAGFGRLLARRHFQLRDAATCSTSSAGAPPAIQFRRISYSRLPTSIRLPPPCGTWPVALSSSRLCSGSSEFESAGRPAAARSLVIVRRLGAEQRQAKAVLPLHRPVARAAVAAQPAEDGDDMPAEQRRDCAGCPAAPRRQYPSAKISGNDAAKPAS